MTRYSEGVEFERKTRALLRDEHGYEIIRSAGSKTKVDLVAIGPVTGVYLIQCKLNGLCPPAERAALLSLSLRAMATPIVAYKAKEGRLRPVRFRELTGPGPKDFIEWTPEAKPPLPVRNPGATLADLWTTEELERDLERLPACVCGCVWTDHRNGQCFRCVDTGCTGYEAVRT